MQHKFIILVLLVVVNNIQLPSENSEMFLKYIKIILKCIHEDNNKQIPNNEIDCRDSSFEKTLLNNSIKINHSARVALATDENVILELSKSNKFIITNNPSFIKLGASIAITFENNTPSIFMNQANIDKSGIVFIPIKKM